MTHGDDIRDLLGRYATGPLTSAERERLFDAALSDQDLFEELAREQECKMLLEEPGARDRMIRALHSPARRAAWILPIAVLTALSIVLVAFLLRPSSKPPQIAIATAPPAPAVSVSEPAPVPEPVATPPAAKTPEPPVAQPSTDAIKKESAELQSAAIPAPAPVPQSAEMQQQQNSPGGPRQMAPRSQALRASALASEQNIGAFGFHYSLDTKGHLVIVPAADGYLFVKSGDGKILFPRKQIAAAITTDIALPDAVNSVIITFTREESAAETKPTPRPESSGAVEGSDNLAIEVKIKSN